MSLIYALIYSVRGLWRHSREITGSLGLHRDKYTTHSCELAWYRLVCTRGATSAAVNEARPAVQTRGGRKAVNAVARVADKGKKRKGR